MKNSSPTLALTPGDPTGIGPEITVKALGRIGEFPDVKFKVIGSLKALEAVAAQLKRPLPKGDHVSYIAVENEKPGVISYESVEQAIRLIGDKEADALVTGPISKRNLKAADINFPGHTEILEELAHRLFNADKARAEMLFVYKNFRLLLLTRHIALKDVPVALARPGAVAAPLKTLIHFLRTRAKVTDPRIALLGINPHCGEVGGSEEEKYYAPVINAVNAIGNSKLEGPFPADGFFRGFNAEEPGYDAVVSAYHDQGLIPFKLLAGTGAVNVTIGLPFLRCSVSHGTADDIAGKGIASEEALMSAIRVALEMV